MPDNVIVENATIDRMLADPKTFGDLPCMNNVTQIPGAKTGCTGCDRPTVNYNAIKHCLAIMSAPNRDALKAKLKCKRVEFIIAAGGRRKRISY